MKLIKIILGIREMFKDKKTGRIFSQNQVNYMQRLGHKITIEKETQKTKTKKNKKKTKTKTKVIKLEPKQKDVSPKTTEK